MEIEMVEMGIEKFADPPTKTDRLTKSTIGNKSLLPEQVRVFSHSYSAAPCSCYKLQVTETSSCQTVLQVIHLTCQPLLNCTAFVV